MNELIVSIAKIKAHLSEYIEKSSYEHNRIIITKREKPVAALVNINDYRLLKDSGERTGLAAIIRKWKGFDEISNTLSDLKKLRKEKRDFRDVSL